MVTQERTRELFTTHSIPRGMWVAISEDGSHLITTGKSRSEVLEAVTTQPCGHGETNPVILQNEG